MYHPLIEGFPDVRGIHLQFAADAFIRSFRVGLIKNERICGPCTACCDWAVAARRGLTHAALSLAWLLAKSPVMLPIPGTRSIDHLKDNVLAAALKLAPEDLDDLE